MDTETAVRQNDVGELHLVALNPQQMQDAQQRLELWALARASREKSREKELKQNYEIAKKSKWRSSTLLVHLRIAQKRSLFFSKLAAAVKEGYYLVPDMPMDTFAIRSKSAAPGHKSKSSTSSSHFGWPWISDESPKSLPAGEGENRNPEQIVRHHEGAPHKNDKGNEVTIRTTVSASWADEIDFPFTLAKPQVLEAADRAMRLKIFDEFGVLPSSPRKDPMVLGRIIGPKGLSATFMVAWFLDEEHFR